MTSLEDKIRRAMREKADQVTGASQRRQAGAPVLWPPP